MTSPYLNQILMPVTSPLYIPKISIIDINDQTTTPLDDNAIEEGDEHTGQITCGPLASMMSIENPETFNEIVSLKNVAFCATPKRIIYRFYSCFTIQTPSICAKLQDCNITCIDEFVLLILHVF